MWSHTSLYSGVSPTIDRVRAQRPLPLGLKQAALGCSLLPLPESRTPRRLLKLVWTPDSPTNGRIFRYLNRVPRSRSRVNDPSGPQPNQRVFPGDSVTLMLVDLKSHRGFQTFRP